MRKYTPHSLKFDFIFLRDIRDMTKQEHYLKTGNSSVMSIVVSQADSKRFGKTHTYVTIRC
jgi:hypothetical protein